MIQMLLSLPQMLSKVNLYAIGAGVLFVLLVGATLWIRHDAVNDFSRKLEVESLRNQLAAEQHERKATELALRRFREKYQQAQQTLEKLEKEDEDFLKDRTSPVLDPVIFDRLRNK